VLPRLFCFLLLIPQVLCALGAGIEILPPGHKPLPPGVHALVGGRIITRPGTVIENGTIIIRDGRVEAVGKDLTAPDDARVWKMEGTTVYAGFIDPYVTAKPGLTSIGAANYEDGPRSSDSKFFGVTGQEKDPGSPGPAYGLAQVTPEKRVAQSYTPDAKGLEGLRELGFTAGNFVPERGIVRGTSAFVLLQPERPNETILKADVFQHVAFDQDSGKEDAYPRSLMGVIAVVRQAFFDGQHYGAQKDYFGKTGATEEKPELNVALEALLPAVRGQIPVAFEPGSALMVDRAARVARELGLNYLLVSSGQEWRRPELAKAAGARFIVPLAFPEVPKMPEEDDWTSVSLDQLRTWDWAPENPALLRKQGLDIALTTYGLADRKNFRKNLRLVLDRGLSEEDALAAMTTIPAGLCGLDKELGTIEPGKIADLTVVEGSYFVTTNKVREVWINGRAYRVQPGSKSDVLGKRPEETKDPVQAKTEKEEKAREEQKQEKKRELLNTRLAKPAQEGRGPLAAPGSILVKNATIWTSADAGRLEKADLLISEGKIKAVGTNLEAPSDTLVIDASGKHVTPGLVDCHSHSMIMGGVNEATLPSTANVRISDVVNSETRRMMEELAGGLTTANELHGSANPIGGQNCVVKLRDGAPPEEMKFANAPPGIKFALGENVKQSNWGGNTRFPQSRMGVRTFMANRFMAAQKYLADWEDFRKREAKAKAEGKDAPPAPRRDLELEAIGEIIAGTRLIHCHSYRQDEILAFLRLMESFGARVATLQHVLEGYKIADEIAKHGCGASCFADWWGYKYEVIDAIPFAGSLMRERGVLVSFNSDSGDLSRRLYTEAAKAVKYGGTSEIEALKFVTINPAKQLRIDKYVGSLEPGKDGDFVIWSASPLDSTTVCLETWIEGKKYSDRAAVPAHTAALTEERDKLLEKAKRVAGLTKEGESNEKAKAAFFQLPMELLHESEDLHCDSF
jgi:imidazolonepropionase-like amidohydrolase